MTAGMAFIIGLVLSGAKMFVIGTTYGDIEKAIKESYPAFFRELPPGYEKYLDRLSTTDLMVYLENNARAGSVVHLRAFANLFSMFVEDVYVDDKDLDEFVRNNYPAYDFGGLIEKNNIFTKKDWRCYVNRISPLSFRYTMDYR